MINGEVQVPPTDYHHYSMPRSLNLLGLNIEPRSKRSSLVISASINVIVFLLAPIEETTLEKTCGCYLALPKRFAFLHKFSCSSTLRLAIYFIFYFYSTPWVGSGLGYMAGGLSLS